MGFPNTGRSDSYRGADWRVKDMPALGRAFKGRPLIVEHDGPAVGEILDAGLAEGEFRISCRIDESTPHGRDAARRVRSGELRSVSYGAGLMGNGRTWDESDAMEGLVAVEYSLVAQEDVEGAKILAFVDPSNVNAPLYVSDYARRNKGTMAEPTADGATFVREPAAAAAAAVAAPELDHALLIEAYQRENPMREVKTIADVAAIMKEQKEQLDKDKAAAEQEKASKEDAERKRFADIAHDEDLQRWIKDAEASGTLKYPWKEAMGDMIDNPKTREIIPSMASMAQQVSSHRKRAAQLEARVKELEGKLPAAATQLTSATRYPPLKSGAALLAERAPARTPMAPPVATGASAALSQPAAATQQKWAAPQDLPRGGFSHMETFGAPGGLVKKTKYF